MTYALCAVPLVGVVELGLHVKETTSDVVPESDWDAAREAVKPEFHQGPSGDLVLFEPFWADPIGREHFKDDLAPRKNEARPDVTRFARVFEVSIRGAHAPELERWKKTSERKVGAITIGVYENPEPVRVLSDTVDLLKPEGVKVFRVDPLTNAEAPCAWTHGAGNPGGLGVPQGPAVPGDRFVCASGTYAGVAVLHALDHHPHLCIFASPPADRSILRLRFPNVKFGDVLHGHSGVQWLVERTPTPEKIELSFSSGDRAIGKHAHKVGAGWTYFEMPTDDQKGKQADLTVDVQGGGRSFCFEADTREAVAGGTK